jgi:hypothetical protein
MAAPSRPSGAGAGSVVDLGEATRIAARGLDVVAVCWLVLLLASAAW